MWHVYVLQCNDGTFYTGITTNLDRRLKEHNTSVKGAKYSRTRRPVTLHYAEHANTRSDAMKRERAIKRTSHQDKMNFKTQ